MLIGACIGAIGCGGGKGNGLPTCVSRADGPGAGFCLVGLERLTLAGGAALPVGRAMILAADDNNAAIVARDSLGFYALSATCRHQCRTVTLCDSTCGQPVVSPNDCAPARSAALAMNGPAFLCPCHGSTYGADGRVLKAPSLQPLSPLAMAIVGADIVVDLSTIASPGDRIAG